MRIVIAGGPEVGKSTLAQKIATVTGFPIRQTDSLVDAYSWSDISTIVSSWYSEKGPWIIEGVAAVRGLRKWFIEHPPALGTKPVDIALYKFEPYIPLTPGQTIMAKGCDTVWKMVRPSLIAVGTLELAWDEEVVPSIEALVKGTSR